MHSTLETSTQRIQTNFLYKMGNSNVIADAFQPKYTLIETGL